MPASATRTAPPTSALAAVLRDLADAARHLAQALQADPMDRPAAPRPRGARDGDR